LGNAVYDNKVNIPLLKNIMGLNYSKVIGSVQHLEYSIAEGLNKIEAKQKKLLLSKEWRAQDILWLNFFCK
jgi:hypothetical protein